MLSRTQRIVQTSAQKWFQTKQPGAEAGLFFASCVLEY